MAETKYGKYILREPISEGMVAEIVNLSGEKDFGGLPFSIGWSSWSEPIFVNKETHKHDFDQVLMFLGGDPMNVRDFGAEVDICLGEEQEKHTIDTTSIVYIPKGLPHLPLNYRKIDKPFVLFNMYFSPSYIKQAVSE